MNKAILLMLLALSGCAGLGLSRSAQYTLGGAAGGATGGYAFSPNEESRALNALFWGALGGAFSYLTERAFRPEKNEGLPSTLESRELFPRPGRDIEVPHEGKTLPEYVRKRLTPVVIEEFKERDAIGEDGSLHEPHRVWRIKQQPELTPGAIK